MDEDVIDVSHLSKEEYKQHMRRLQQLHTSPCLYCTAVCTDWVRCKKYQKWYRMANRIKR